MSYASDLALLAAGSYWDIRQDDNPNTPNDDSNRAPLPEGWKVLTQFDKSDAGATAVTGFSARVVGNWGLPPCKILNPVLLLSHG